MLRRDVLKALLVLIALSGVACESQTPQPASYEVHVPMRDGVRLAADVYFPTAGSPPYPVVLIRTPYNKAWMADYGRYYAASGFAVAIQDVRGRWASEGEWEPFRHEGDDGYDTIEWLGTREWSTGKVGMVGGSYSGTVQFAAAVRRPPHLVTIVPNGAPAMPFSDIPRDGGVLALGWALRWTDIVENARTGKELQARVQRSIRSDWTEPLKALPVLELDESVVGREVSYFRDWVRHATDDDYWQAMSDLDEVEGLEVPVFLQSGWFDPGTRGARLAFERIVRGGNRHVRLLLGPWAHGDRGTRYLNGVDMGQGADRDLMAESRRWLEYWLETDAQDAPDSPGVELYLMGSNRWLAGSGYPLEGTEFRRLYLSDGPSSSPSGGLAWEASAGTGSFDTFTYDPGSPTPSFHAALKRGSLGEYRTRTDSGGDVLVYESAPLTEPLDIAGPIEATIYASSSAEDTDWTATLSATTTSGDVRVLGLTFGILRARYRESFASPSLMVPGTVYPFVIDMGHTAVTIQPGERLRLEIASAAFPEFSRNLNTGGESEQESVWVKANQKVYRDASRPSHLLLPVIPRSK